ncbi:MAG: hypothetical protein EPN85_12790 [Bacteroidetes bacterium]|nr:MAG: hypothetical protein EPN85_12790 [Bacteroidota bacterium]
MKAIIRTSDRNLFHSLLQFLKTIHVTVETEDEKTIESKTKKFNPQEYEGILSHLNLDIEKELLNMRKAWKRNS